MTPLTTRMAARLGARWVPHKQPAQPWFCDQGNFWGTSAQLVRCARCGKSDSKHLNEPRHFALKPSLHMLCDECFDTLPDDDAAILRAGDAG